MTEIYPYLPRVDDLIAEFTGDLARASHGRLCIDIVERYGLDELPPAAVPNVEGFIFAHQWLSRDTYFAVLTSLFEGRGVDFELTHHGGADYQAILMDPRFGIVDKINTGAINMVFILSPPRLGFWETAMAGPRAYPINGGVYGAVPTNKRFVVMAHSTDRDSGLWLHVASHMVEWVMDHVSRGWPKSRSHGGRDFTAWEAFVLTEFANYRPEWVVPGSAQVGNAHFPPNGLADYDYYNAQLVTSYAPDWYDYPDVHGAHALVNRDTWGTLETPDNNYQRGYLYWWFDHLPREPGEHDGILNDWWQYAWDVNLPRPEALAWPIQLRDEEPRPYCLDGRLYRTVDGSLRDF